jgi:hypothetical protein
VAHTYNPNIQAAEAGEWRRIQGQPELQRDTVSKKRKVKWGRGVSLRKKRGGGRERREGRERKHSPAPG